MRFCEPFGDFFELALTDIDSVFGWSCRFDASASSDDFTGRWFAYYSDEDIRRFADQLKEVERTRHGRATLNSMSPDEVLFSIGVIDRAGHTGVTGHIRKPAFSVGGEHLLRFAIGFESPTLVELIAMFEGLLLPDMDAETWLSRFDRCED